MKRFGIKISCVFLLSMIIFSCKKKIDNGKGSPNPTETSYNIKDFEIQDEADGRILDREDIHRIKQHTAEEVMGEGLVDTIYLQVMVDLDKLKLKLRFYDPSMVTSIDPDTNKVRDLNKYEGQEYPTMKVSFNNGLVRTLAIVASKITNQDLIDLILNQRIYYLKNYQLWNGTEDVTAQTTRIKFTQHTPQRGDKTTKDTIELKLASTYAGGNMVTFKPAIVGAWGSDTVQNVEATPEPFTITLPSTAYHNVVYTFSNGFKREIAVKIEKAPSTAITFTKFSIVEAGIKYADKDTLIVAEPTTTMNTDNEIIIVRPLMGWNKGRKVTLKFEGLPTTEYKIDGGTATATPTSGEIEIDFPINNDVAKLTLTNTDAGGESKEYTIKLLSGMLKKPTLVMDGTSTSSNYFNNTDKEFKIAVDENNVYVLIVNGTTSIGTASFKDLTNNNVSYDIYVYPIAGNVNPIGTLPLSANSSGYFPMVTNGNKIIDIVSFDNKLYGIAATPDGYFQIFQWPSIVSNASPVAISTQSITAIANINSGYTSYSLYTASLEGNIINFYSASSPNKGTSGVLVSKISANITGTVSAPSTISTVLDKTFLQNSSTSSGGYAHSTFLNLGKDRGMFVAQSYGFIIGNNFDKAVAGESVTPRSFKKYSLNGADKNPLGGNLELIRDVYYFIQGGIYPGKGDNYMYIFNFERDIATTLKGINLPEDMVSKVIYSDKMGSNPKNANEYNQRGNCRTYKMSNGKVRIAMLINMSGFKVWDME